MSEIKAHIQILVEMAVKTVINNTITKMAQLGECLKDLQNEVFSYQSGTILVRIGQLSEQVGQLKDMLADSPAPTPRQATPARPPRPAETPTLAKTNVITDITTMMELTTEGKKCAIIPEPAEDSGDEHRIMEDEGNAMDHEYTHTKLEHSKHAAEAKRIRAETDTSILDAVEEQQPQPRKNARPPPRETPQRGHQRGTYRGLEMPHKPTTQSKPKSYTDAARKAPPLMPAPGMACIGSTLKKLQTLRASRSSQNPWRGKDLWQARLHNTPNWKVKWNDPRNGNGHGGLQEPNQPKSRTGGSIVRRAILDRNFPNEVILLMGDIKAKEGPWTLKPLEEAVKNDQKETRVNWDKRMVELVTFDIADSEGLVLRFLR
ncbi:hypothetical protein BDZ91DRAFT_802787 [Kalaharituber pfeilii]|nr:hypothetical protein BDZ91DRAFT_802787 [Kalaharituber pfeilii]